MKCHCTILCLFFFNINFSQDVQQVEVLKNDKQVKELFDELGDSEMKLTRVCHPPRVPKGFFLLGFLFGPISGPCCYPPSAGLLI